MASVEFKLPSGYRLSVWGDGTSGKQANDLAKRYRQYVRHCPLKRLGPARRGEASRSDYVLATAIHADDVAMPAAVLSCRASGHVVYLDTDNTPDAALSEAVSGA